jgi:TPR repeat protein
MKKILKSGLGACSVCTVLLMLMAGEAYGAMSQGVYAYVEISSDDPRKAKIRDFVSIAKARNGYLVRLTTGSQILVTTANYRGSVYYPSIRENNLNALKSSRQKLRQFMSDFPASNRNLAARATNVSLKILQIEKAAESKKLKRIGTLILKNGKEYRDAVLSEKLDDGVKIIHQQGVATIPAELLPDSIVKKLGGFDASKMKLARVKAELVEVEKKAGSGDLNALWKLGKLYHDGESIPKDVAKSFQYFEKAATRGNAPSQLLVGMGYYQGEGVKKNLELAVSWVKKAAKQGLPETQTSLGIFCLRGDGVKQNSELACEWFQKAADLEDAEAQYFLGVCYYMGEGVIEDHRKAKKLLEKSRDAGVKNASAFLSKHSL